MASDNISRWIIAARPRTLPLALAGPILGSCMAYAEQNFRWGVAFWSLITTILLQILSNFANDYGDFVKGSDHNRKGPVRALQSNLITVDEMKKAIYLISILAFVSGSLLIFRFAAHLTLRVQLIFLLTGLLAIYAAIKYTIGKKPYGYQGWGDAFVFLFFGLVSTVGTFILHTGFFHYNILFPAISMGLLSTAVLNVNNIRDFYEDLQNNKRTVAVILGTKKAKIYHLSLIAFAWICLIIPPLWHYRTPFQFVFIITVPLFLQRIYNIFHHSDANTLNRELKRLAMSTFLLSLLWGIGQII